MDTTTERYGMDSDWLAAALGKWWVAEDPDGKLEYVDNCRLAKKGDAAEEAEYEDARSDGCCGSVDVEIGPAPSGATYLYGFNHGH